MKGTKWGEGYTVCEPRRIHKGVCRGEKTAARGWESKDGL